VAKANRFFSTIYGTAEAVPFQNQSFTTSYLAQREQTHGSPSSSWSHPFSQGVHGSSVGHHHRPADSARLESTVEWFHHRHLARDARENIVQEVRANQQDVLREVNALPAEEKHLDEILGWMDSTQHGHPVKPNWNFMWTTILPRDSAWSAASSTGAIAFMSYDEVKVYSKLYAMQNLYSMLVERNLAERHDLNVVLFGMEATGKLSEAEFEKEERSSCRRRLGAGRCWRSITL